MKKALLKATSRKNVKGAFINILGGITRCDEVSLGIVDVLKENPNLKFAVRMMGTVITSYSIHYTKLYEC